MYNMKKILLPFLYSFAVILLFACGRVSEPNPILGKWQPDSNLKTIVVFSDSLRLHSCAGVKSYGYKLENFGKELTVNDIGRIDLHGYTSTENFQQIKLTILMKLKMIIE